MSMTQTKTLVPTVHAETLVPAEHLVTTLPGPNSTVYWLYGYRAWDTTAHYTLIHDGAAQGDGTDVILDNVNWPTAYPKVTAILGAAGTFTEQTLRSVLPHATTRLSEPEVDTIQSALKQAMSTLDACGQDDLSEQVKAIFKQVAARAFPA